MSVKDISLEITIDKEGNISYKVIGVKGKDCVKETKFLDDALGVVEERKFTRDYYQQGVKSNRRVTTRR